MKALQRLFAPSVLVMLLYALSPAAGANDFEAELGWAGLHVVNFPFDGGVIRVHVRPGDRVSKGRTLIELNPEPVDIRVRQYVAELDARKPVLADAKRDYEHAKSLYEQTVLSDVELQRSQHAYEKASAELAAARARLDHALWQKKQTVATAPFDGRVVARRVEPGQMLVAEQRSRPLLVPPGPCGRRRPCSRSQPASRSRYWSRAGSLRRPSYRWACPRTWPSAT